MPHTLDEHSEDLKHEAHEDHICDVLQHEAITYDVHVADGLFYMSETVELGGVHDPPMRTVTLRRKV